MLKKKFSQPSLAITDQLSLLKEQGLIIHHSHTATHYLKTIGFYRLKAYFQPFLINYKNPNKRFKPGKTFSEVLNLYMFDRELRLLVIDAIERIEVALRTVLSNTMSMKYGAHWYLEEKLFICIKTHELFLKKVWDHLKHSKEDFIKNYYSKYELPKHPPSWMVFECLSFGTISKAYSNIKDRSARKEVSNAFNQFSETLKSWMKALTFTRNVCAHHSRLWNRFFINKPSNISISYSESYNPSPFVIQAYIIIKLLHAIDPDNHWKNDLYKLFKKYENFIPFLEMGFLENWIADPLWTTK